MTENEAFLRYRKLAADGIWKRGEFEAAGCLRRSILLDVKPARDGRPIVWLRSEDADARLLRSLTWCHNRADQPGPLDLAFVDVLPHFTHWPRFHFEVVDHWPRAA